jgi:rod shape-determining protein MreD
MSVGRASRWQLVVVMAVLVLLHFYVRPRLWNARVSPDFLFVALMILAMRSRPGTGAIVGFIVGIAADSLTPARFGAAALAHTVVGYLAAWGRAVFFADNLLVNFGMFAGGLWLRDLLLVISSGTPRAQLLHELFVLSPLQALATAAFGVIILLAFRQWFAIRLDV